MGQIEDAWGSVDRGTDSLAESMKRLMTLALKAKSLSREGSLEGVLKVMEALTDEIRSAAENAEVVRAAARGVGAELAAPNALACEVEADMRELGVSGRVWRNMSEVVAFPVVMNLKSARVVVAKRTVVSQRPSVITGIAREALKDGVSPDRFIKALQTAFALVNGGRETGRVALASIHQVLATTAPGVGGYSLNDFRVDLQWLRASGVTATAGGLHLRLEVASAGPSAIPMFEPEGDLVNVGYLSFSTNGEPHA